MEKESDSILTQLPRSLYLTPNAHLMKQSNRLSWPAAAIAFVAAWLAPGIAALADSDALAQSFQPIEIYVPPPENQEVGICPGDLEWEIGDIVDTYDFVPGKWGILVQTLDEGQTLYSRNPDTFFIPASNVKLLTTAAALQRYTPETPIYSETMRDWVSETNTYSDNDYADTLLEFVGGSGVVRQTLSELGVDPQWIRQVDGSGLSRSNLATPRALVRLLRAMRSAKNSDVFYASLPIAGRSGTLTYRFRDTAVEGSVRAKTGTLWGVRALSGYLIHPSYGTLVFSILANHPEADGSDQIAAIDDVVGVLKDLTPCQ